MTLNSYYNRYDPAKKYDRTLFLAGRGLQSAELNEMQNYALHNLKGIGDAIFRDGDVIRGGTCVVDPDTGETTLEAGFIYLRGAVREIGSTNFTIPTNATVRIGVWYVESTMTELEDPGLRDPAIGTRNYQEPGAARLKAEISWDFQVDGIAPPAHEGEFYPIYGVENGVLIQHAPPPQFDAVNSALARYDRESNGSYVVTGMDVRYLDKDNGEQVFVINEGKAHVDGFEIELAHSLRVRFAIDPDIQEIDSDPYTFQPGAGGVMDLVLNEAPANQILNVDVTVQKTITMTHGSYAGAMDPIPDTAVLEIIQIKQGTTTYVSGTDYKLKSGDVDWSLPGAEPAPGSSYQITYRCRSKITPQNVTEDGFKISGAVDGTLVLVDYSWMMPRYDLITIDAKGVVRRIKGLAHPWRPSVPKAPSGQLALAYVYQNWRSATKPDVFNNAIHAIPMSDIEAMRSSINDLYDLIAQERLRNDANSREPAAKKGIFVDPFFDDDMRDQGINQTAAIVDRELVLPIGGNIADAGKGVDPWLLPYVLEPVLEQLLQTVEMKINPYQAFAPIPAKVAINLNVDRWTEVETTWSSPITQRFSVLSSPITRQVVVGGGILSRVTSSTTQNVSVGTQMSQTNELLSSTSREAAFMRQATQTFELDGFTPGEQLRLVFDGINVEPVSL